MMKNRNRRYGLCAIVLCAFTIQTVLPDFKGEQNGIAIVVEDFRNEFGDFLPFPAESGIMSGRQMLYNQVQPVRVTIHNKSDKPVIVNLSSLPAKHVEVQSILSGCQDRVLWSLLLTFVGLYTAIPFFGIEDSSYRYPYLTYPFPVTTAWLGATVVAAIAPWFFVKSKKEQAKRELDTFCLYNETVVKPGYKVNRLAFLDATTYSSFFTFRVLSEDKMEFVATFDVDMLGA